MQRKICEIARRPSLCTSFAYFLSCRRRLKLKYWENKSCDQARQSEQIIEKRTAVAVSLSSLQNAATLRELEETAYWLELLVDAKCVASDKLSLLRQECDELIAIFVTILKRSKETS